jgi:guanylate kinase
VRKKLIIFTAPSGSGKTTLVRHLLSKRDDLVFSVSATTRTKRYYEVEGEDYYFLSNELFAQKVENDEFIEWEEVYDSTYYGTLKSEVERIWLMGKNVIFDVDVKGALNIKNQYPDDTLSVFVKVPTLQELELRLRSRMTESEESLQKRLQRIRLELTYEKQFDMTVLNDDLEKAKQQSLLLVQNFLDNDRSFD